jgi:hypothetical protein
MDYLDPTYEKRALRKLYIGYGLVALVIGMASLILLYWSYGYGLDKKGDVMQSGLVFVSSQPTAANVYFNGQIAASKTNARFVLPSKDYALRVSKAGYHDWAHAVQVRGGDVQRFDYPLLVPKQLTATTIATYDSAISMLTQTPNRRWILALPNDKNAQFIQYDLRDPAKPVTTTLALPAESFTRREAGVIQTWSAIEWADDNRYVLIEHTYGAANEDPAGREYILFDRRSPENSVNVTRTLSLSPAEQLTLFNKQSDMLYGYNTETKVLRSILLTPDGSRPLVTLPHVYGYKTYSDDTILYVTDTPPNGVQLAGSLSVVLQQGSRSTVLRRLPASAQRFILDIARYDRNWYVVVGANTEEGAHIYKNPQTQVLTKSGQLPLAWRFLKLANPAYGGFSTNARFISVQNAQSVAVYDAELANVHAYTLPKPMDAPQQHAMWMDGHRLLYVAGGVTYITDYDNTNHRALQPAQASSMPLFSSDYHYLYTVTTDANAKTKLAITPLVLP